MTSPRYEIEGGADDETAAAIGAVIAHLAAGEVAARANPRPRPRQSPWVLAWRPRDIPAPLPSHTFESSRWTGAGDGDGDEA